jgi:hypothetical protein
MIMTKSNSNLDRGSGWSLPARQSRTSIVSVLIVEQSGGSPTGSLRRQLSIRATLISSRTWQFSSAISAITRGAD